MFSTASVCGVDKLGPVAGITTSATSTTRPVVSTKSCEWRGRRRRGRCPGTRPHRATAVGRSLVVDAVELDAEGVELVHCAAGPGFLAGASRSGFFAIIERTR